VSASRRLAVWLYGAAAATYLLDRLTKVWAENVLAGRAPIQIVPRVLQFNYTDNSGGAFGIGGSAPWLFATATIVVSAVIVAGSFNLSRLPVAIALGLVLGGALGNLTDRLIRDDGFLAGRVVDFIDFRVWPVFNVADGCIVIGALLLLIATAPRRREAG